MATSANGLSLTGRNTATRTTTQQHNPARSNTYVSSGINTKQHGVHKMSNKPTDVKLKSPLRSLQQPPSANVPAVTRSTTAPPALRSLAGRKVGDLSNALKVATPER